MGFESVGGKCVFSSEFDEDACKTYEANFGEHPSGDITKINAADIPDFDILLGGFPCQAFSIIGKKEGFANETCGTLFFDIERILREKRPPAFMLENVRNLVAHDNGNTFKIIRQHLEVLGYHVHAKVLNALDYGVPQKRERIIIVGFLKDLPFEFPLPIKKVKDYICLTYLKITLTGDIMLKKIFVYQGSKDCTIKIIRSLISHTKIWRELLRRTLIRQHYGQALPQTIFL